MSKGAWMHVNLGASKVRVPVVDDPATTQKIAAQITKRLQEIEEDADRIDTLYFFQLTAFQMAAALHQAEQDHDADSREILDSLEKMHRKLQRLLDAYQPEKPATIRFPDPSS